MAEVPETQEQFSGRPPWCGFDVGAGFKPAPTTGAEVPETQEQFSGYAPSQVESVYPRNGVWPQMNADWRK